VSATTQDPPPPAGQPSTAGQRPEPPGPPRPAGRRPVVPGLVLIAIGSLWLAHVLGVPIVWTILLPAAVVLVGLAVLVGGSSPVTAGLVPLGVVLAIAAGIVTLLPGASSFEAGDRVLVVDDLADLQEVYELGAGQLTLDLRGLELPSGSTDVRVDVGLGDLRIRVPEEATVVVDARVTAGELVAFGTRVDGVGARRQVTDAGREGAGTLEIEAQVGLGTLEVSR
jgi:hypothetical protein